MDPYRGERSSTSPGPCPRCPSSQLEEKDAGDVRVDVCHTCHGIWLDGAGMLDLLIASPRTLGRLAGAATEVSDRPEPAPCPQCRTVMRVEAGKSGVRYDVCDEHGVWFDAGELAVVLRFVGGEQGNAEAREEPFGQVITRLQRRWPWS